MKKEMTAAEMLLKKANACLEKGETLLAEAAYKNILDNAPYRAEALNGLGRCFLLQKKFEAAEIMFRQLIDLAPEMPLAYWNLGLVLCRQGQLAEAFALYRQHAYLAYNRPANSRSVDEPLFHKLHHDDEQLAHLKGKGLNQAKQKEKLFHIADCPRLIEGALNITPFRENIVDQWASASPQIVVIDNFLTERALDQLRQFCLDSTIWRTVYPDGYLGAFPEHGMGSPLLAQIAEEMRQEYSAIFGPHLLKHFWGFKYDSQLRGIAVHADDAAVNVNFWITPDEANLNPNSGGLIVWDQQAPLDWGFDKYNDDVPEVRAYLDRTGAKATRIPYRSNRAVIFDSNLFHETDIINFRPGYLNRRINITLLFGKRGQNRIV